ncbi:OmpH family outer membrane protein [Sphingobacteriales bacterium UPWRP_1]|nr:hypothetical protein B6N25_02865 [Sphingobacteriales bacterium TSM_CSS]PSJ75995.1 OmpH family outer membrane protein [Sphingobacteriales bacterium UPWRP_1]
MKTFLKLFVLSFCFMALTATFAQPKIGHLNSVDLLNSLNEWKTAQVELETFANKIQEQLKAKQKTVVDEYNVFVQKVQNGELTPKQQDEQQQYFQRKQSELDQDQTKAQQDLMKREDELTTPIRDKVMNAIKAVAQEKGYNYIIDTSVGATLYSSPDDDVTAFVKAKLQ